MKIRYPSTVSMLFYSQTTYLFLSTSLEFPWEVASTPLSTTVGGVLGLREKGVNVRADKRELRIPCS